jgi:DNA-binding phage protein
MIKIACRLIQFKDLTKVCKEAGITTLYQLQKVLIEKGIKNSRAIYKGASPIGEEKFNEILNIIKSLKK